MTSEKGPEWWANRLSCFLDGVLKEDRFPVNAARVATEYTQNVFPDDPVAWVKGEDLKSFEGALIADPSGSEKWGIAYTNLVTSEGRKNFTIAHELGHYLVHRKKHPNGIKCSRDDMDRWGSEYRKTEREANQFAASLLMPRNDFRRQIPESKKPDLEEIGKCAARYGVSLTAAINQWLSCTATRALLVASRDGYILWARANRHAFNSGIFIKVRGAEPILVPSTSPTMSSNPTPGLMDPVKQAAGAWVSESVVEHSLISKRHDQNLSLLILPNSAPKCDTDEEPEPDLVDRFEGRAG